MENAFVYLQKEFGFGAPRAEVIVETVKGHGKKE